MKDGDFSQQRVSSHTNGPAARAYGLTDVGKKRVENQDQFLIAELRKSMLVKSSSLPLDRDSRLFGGARGQLLVVADGMGGHAAGQRASSVALDQLISQLLNTVHWFLQVEHDCEDDFIDSLKELLRQAHARILAEAAADRTQTGMGTTLTMAHIVWPRMYVVHAGDSRCYLIRDGECQQLTTDHTLAHQLVEAGGLRAEDEETSRWSNVLYNVLGGSGEQELLAEVSRTILREGDTILLCSDGLTRYLRPSDFVAANDELGDDVEGTCRKLVQKANDAGGEDNITVVVSKPTGKSPALEASTVQTEIPLHNLLESASRESDFDLQSPSGEGSVDAIDFADEETLPQ